MPKFHWSAATRHRSLSCSRVRLRTTLILDAQRWARWPTLPYGALGLWVHLYICWIWVVNISWQGLIFPFKVFPSTLKLLIPALNLPACCLLIHLNIVEPKLFCFRCPSIYDVRSMLQRVYITIYACRDWFVTTMYVCVLLLIGFGGTRKIEMEWRSFYIP